MLQYLVIILDDSSVSYCHYSNKDVKKLINLDDLKSAVLFAMKENLNIQFVLPDYQLPNEYLELIDSIDHCTIVSDNNESNIRFDADVIVVDKWSESEVNNTIISDKAYVVRTTYQDFLKNYKMLDSYIKGCARLNIVYTDYANCNNYELSVYEDALLYLAEAIKIEYSLGHYVQLNILTDRLLLTQMNNCGAGDNTITLAPNGNFYICPAFYYSNEENVGNPRIGLNIKNPQLFTLSHSPLCKHCDAYHCKRCVWTNKAMTLEVNVPSSEQCIMSHLERNVSAYLLMRLRQLGDYFPNTKLEKTSCLDPFDLRETWMDY